MALSVAIQDLPQIPRDGDKILVLKQGWLDLILQGEKTLEIRGRRMKGGVRYFASQGFIQGVALFEDSFPITTTDVWLSLAAEHRVDRSSPIYKTPFASKVVRCVAIPHLRYFHPRGAVGNVIYRG